MSIKSAPLKGTLQKVQFMSRNCSSSLAREWELFKKFSSSQKNVRPAQKFSSAELFSRSNVFFKRTKLFVQLLSNELLDQTSCFTQICVIDQFLSEICSKRSASNRERFERFF